MNFHESRIELNSARASTIIRRLLIASVSLVYTSTVHISHSNNCISITLSTVFLSLYQLCFFQCVNCISFTVSLFQMYFSHSIKCISLTESIVFLSLHQMYFYHCINSISFTVSTVFISLYQLYIYHCINCNSLTWLLVVPVHVSYTFLYRVEFCSGIDNYPQSVDRAPGGCDLTVTTSTREIVRFSYSPPNSPHPDCYIIICLITMCPPIENGRLLKCLGHLGWGVQKLITCFMIIQRYDDDK